MKLYYVDDNYRDYLRYYDEKVSRKTTRPFVGVVTYKNNHPYFTPLTSRRRNNNQIYVKLKLGKEDLGGCVVNNTIPVINNNYHVIDIHTNFDEEGLRKRSVALRKQGFEQTKKKFNHLYEKRYCDSFFDKVCCDWEKLEKAARNYDYIINNSFLVSKINNKELMLDQDDPHIINHIIKDREGNIIERKPTLKLVDGNLSVNPDYNYAHLEESMYQDMVDNIKRGEGKANQLITPIKTKDNDYER